MALRDISEVPRDQVESFKSDCDAMQAVSTTENIPSSMLITEFHFNNNLVTLFQSF